MTLWPGGCQLGGGSTQPWGGSGPWSGVQVVSSPVPSFLEGAGLCGLELLIQGVTAPWRENPLQNQERRTDKMTRRASGDFVWPFFSHNPNSSCLLTSHADMVLGLRATSAKSCFHDGGVLGVQLGLTRVSIWGVPRLPKQRVTCVQEKVMRTDIA